MQLHHRLLAVRSAGPRRPILRHILEVLAFYDTDEGSLVYGGSLERDTGYSDRAIRRALGDLVVLGWLRPEISASATDPRMEVKNQHGRLAVQRVHGHLGGCMPGGVGRKTRYWITYRTTAADEPPPRRQGGPTRGNGRPAEGGTGGRTDVATDPTRGNGRPERGNGRPDKGAARSPDPICNPVSIRDGGGTPPYPPGGGEPVAPQGAPEPPLGADAPLGPSAAPPVTIQGTRAQEERQIEQAWTAAVGQLQLERPTDMALRLWLKTPKVRPIHLTDGVLHLACPSPRYAASIADRYADALCALLSARLAPVLTIVCHPQESAA